MELMRKFVELTNAKKESGRMAIGNFSASGMAVADANALARWMAENSDALAAEISQHIGVAPESPGESGRCSCGKEVSGQWVRCEACRRTMREDIDALFEVCRSQHRGAGGAAICICGAGCGGSKACRGLSVLQRALECADERVRNEIIEIIGWTPPLKTILPRQFQIRKNV
jgi:hypothetical protein